MNRFDHRKYRPFEPISKPDRRWPDKRITQAPRWASVDLRDGNQALSRPMNVEQKLEFFDLLIAIGCKEIEVGFPAASQPDFDFVRRIIEEQRIPEDVSIQVLTQAREDLIARTFEALRGVNKAIVHVYNSTNPVQREQVFRLDRAGVMDIARRGARWVKKYAEQFPATEWTFEYSPESFSQTEPDFALDVCNAVNAIWQPREGQSVIINLPATVESSTPNVFADQVEWFCDNLPDREYVCISVHTHNDRGSAVAASELAILAGADRVEGTLFGNGERTGNMDIITLAMNLYSQGIDPRLDFSDPQRILSCYRRCTGMPVHPRHPWVGKWVYTAFSGSHQDAIRKGMRHYRSQPENGWQVPYLPIDPADIGRRYEEVVRINSQSGKGGVAHVLERDYGIDAPAWLARELSRIVQAESEASGEEVPSQRIYANFQAHFCVMPESWRLAGYAISRIGQRVEVRFQLEGDDKDSSWQGYGRGLVEALVDAITRRKRQHLKIEYFDQQALTRGTDAQALAIVRTQLNGAHATAAAFSNDTASATIQCVLSAAGRLMASDNDEGMEGDVPRRANIG